MKRDYTLSEDQEQVRQLARDFAENELRPRSAEWDREAEFHGDILPMLGELGFMGMLLPEEYGGLDLGMLTYLLALEQIASKRFPLEKITTHRFGLKDVDLAIRSVGNEGVPGVIHASLMPWE